jgi:hypothetical protein
MLILLRACGAIDPLQSSAALFLQVLLQTDIWLIQQGSATSGNGLETFEVIDRKEFTLIPGAVSKRIPSRSEHEQPALNL